MRRDHDPGMWFIALLLIVLLLAFVTSYWYFDATMPLPEPQAG
jgi:hypothetical protein